MSLLTLLATSLARRRSGAIGDRIRIMMTSMGFTEDESERDDKQLFTEIV
jgi:hypothetical protein